MSHCERCGATNQPHSRFCVSCGSPMIEGPPPGAPQQQHPQQQHPPPQQHPPQQQHPPPQQHPPQQHPPQQHPPQQPQQQHPPPQQHSPQQQSHPPYQPAPPGYGQPAPRQSYPSPPAYPGQYGHPPREGPNPFAETAGPAGSQEHEAARQAAMGTPGSQYPAPPPGGYPGATSRPPAPYASSGHGYDPTASPAEYPGAPQAPSTAHMPGVSQDPDAIPEGAPPILAGFLVSYETEALGKFWPIHQGRTLLGREGGGPVDVGIPHPTTSSRHALVHAAARPGRMKIEDMGSTNGTFVNDKRLQTGHRHELQDGDRLRFGLFTAIVKII